MDWKEGTREMAGRRRLTITIETDEVIVVRNDSVSIRAWCSACERETLLVGPQQAAHALGLTAHALHARVASGEAHGSTGPDGTLICLNSLLR